MRGLSRSSHRAATLAPHTGRMSRSTKLALGVVAVLMLPAIAFVAGSLSSFDSAPTREIVIDDTASQTETETATLREQRAQERRERARQERQERLRQQREEQRSGSSSGVEVITPAPTQVDDDGDDGDDDGRDDDDDDDDGDDDDRDDGDDD